jgi:hypothetical protein
MVKRDMMTITIRPLEPSRIALLISLGQNIGVGLDMDLKRVTLGKVEDLTVAVDGGIALRLEQIPVRGWPNYYPHVFFSLF